MVERLIGEWRLESSENFEAILLHFRVNYFLRKLALTLKPNTKIEYNESTKKWTITIVSTFRTIQTEFEIGAEFAEDTPDGRKVKTIVHVEGDKFIGTQRDLQGNVVCVTTRELLCEDEYCVTLQAGDICARRLFRRIK